MLVWCQSAAFTAWRSPRSKALGAPSKDLWLIHIKRSRICGDFLTPPCQSLCNVVTKIPDPSLCWQLSLVFFNRKVSSKVDKNKFENHKIYQLDHYTLDIEKSTFLKEQSFTQSSSAWPTPTGPSAASAPLALSCPCTLCSGTSPSLQWKTWKLFFK